MTSIQTILNKSAKKKDKLIDCCQRSFCILCLQHNYDNFSYEEIRKVDWYCPFCKGICTCTRCMRQDQLTKMRAHLFSLGGELSHLLNEKSELDHLFGQYWVNISKIMTKVEENPLNMIEPPTATNTSDEDENLDFYYR